MIVVAGKVRIKPERRQAAIDAALRMQQATQAEAGCVAYHFYASLEDPNLFFVFEEWESEKALERHFQTAHMEAFQRQLPEFLDGEIRIKQYVIASSSGL